MRIDEKIGNYLNESKADELLGFDYPRLPIDEKQFYYLDDLVNVKLKSRYNLKPLNSNKDDNAYKVSMGRNPEITIWPANQDRSISIRFEKTGTNVSTDTVSYGLRVVYSGITPKFVTSFDQLFKLLDGAFK